MKLEVLLKNLMSIFPDYFTSYLFSISKLYLHANKTSIPSPLFLTQF